MITILRWSNKDTTTNCRVSFIDLYLVFPANVRIVFLPHTNTVILLEPYCGTLTEPGLPVLPISLKAICVPFSAHLVPFIFL